MPKGQPTPAYKFRLLCKSCNSYMTTFIEVADNGEVLLRCGQCGARAIDLDELREVKP